MSNNEPLLEKNSQDPLVTELKKILYRLLIYTGKQNNIDLDDYSNILIDYKQVVENGNQFGLHSLINKALSYRKRLILLNVNDGEQLSKILGIGFNSRCIIVRPYNKYNVFNVLELYESDTQNCSQVEVTQNINDGSRTLTFQDKNCLNNSFSGCQNSFRKSSVFQKARAIENILSSDFTIPQEFHSSPPGSTPGDLPKEQVWINYLTIDST